LQALSGGPAVAPAGVGVTSGGDIFARMKLRGVRGRRQGGEGSPLPTSGNGNIVIVKTDDVQGGVTVTDGNAVFFRSDIWRTFGV